MRAPTNRPRWGSQERTNPREDALLPSTRQVTPTWSQPQSRPWDHLAGRTALVVGAALLLTIETLTGFASYVSNGLFGHVGMDFLTTYTASIIIGDGNAQSLYDLWTQRFAQYPILVDHHVQWPDRSLQPYVAPPLLGLLALPLRALAVVPALVVWVVLSAGLIALAAHVLDRELDLGLGRLAPLVAISFFPAFYTLLLGQSEALLLAGVVGFLYLFRRGDDFPAGLALGILVLKPPLLVVPAIYLATKQCWRALAGFATAAGAGGLLSALLLGPQGIRDYLQLTHELGQPLGTIATNVPGMINIRGAIVRLLPTAPALAQEFTIVGVSLVVLGISVVLWRRAGKTRGSMAEGAELALMLTTMVLVSYHTLIHTGTLLLPAIALLWQVGHGAVTGERFRAALISLVVVSWVAPVLAFVPSGSSLVPAIVSTPLVFGLWLLASECLVRTTTPEPVLAEVPSRTGEQDW